MLVRRRVCGGGQVFIRWNRRSRLRVWSDEVPNTSSCAIFLSGVERRFYAKKCMSYCS
jgi:hypothetical protein